MSIEQEAIRTLQEQELDPYWVALFEQALAELRGLGVPGERMLHWFVQEFWYGRVQAWVDAVGADASQVCASAVGAAQALESRRNRHEPLPDWRAFTWGEMLDWVADAVASRVEDDDKAPPVWRERNVVYRFDDGWTIERVKHPEDLNQESRLMRNCAGIIPAFFEPLLSLRDPEGRPHLDIKLNLSGRVVEIAGKAQGPIKSAYAARLRTVFEEHRPYYAETEWSAK